MGVNLASDKTQLFEETDRAQQDGCEN
jgi:hypothetical protein